MRAIERLTGEQVEQIKRCHLLLCMYNAFQPGIFALSGWDLVGALTVPAEQVADLLADGDTRWIHRGAYDLMGVDPEATGSAAGLPKARALYGSLPEQFRRRWPLLIRHLIHKQIGMRVHIRRPQIARRHERRRPQRRRRRHIHRRR